MQFSEKPIFLEKPNPLGFGGFIGFWALLGFRIFYLNEQLGNLLVDLAKLLFRFASSLDYLKIRIFIIYLLLLVSSCKYKKIFNYYWRNKLKFN